MIVSLKRLLINVVGLVNVSYEESCRPKFSIKASMVSAGTWLNVER